VASKAIRLDAPDSIAACAKHYVGYGAGEGGRDYNTTWIPEIELRNVFLRPFRAVRDAGVATFMSAFNDLNGVPATVNAFTLRKVLRDEWKFDGFVVSDWNSVGELIPQGLAAGDDEAAFKAVRAGVDMEMVSTAYYDTLKPQIESGRIPMKTIDDAVRNILRVKFHLGLFDGRDVHPRPAPPDSREAMDIAQAGRRGSSIRRKLLKLGPCNARAVFRTACGRGPGAGAWRAAVCFEPIFALGAVSHPSLHQLQLPPRGISVRRQRQSPRRACVAGLADPASRSPAACGARQRADAQTAGPGTEAPAVDVQNLRIWG
jgi:hypothetical protein